MRSNEQSSCAPVHPWAKLMPPQPLAMSTNPPGTATPTHSCQGSVQRLKLVLAQMAQAQRQLRVGRCNGVAAHAAQAGGRARARQRHAGLAPGAATAAHATAAGHANTKGVLSTRVGRHAHRGAESHVRRRCSVTMAVSVATARGRHIYTRPRGPLQHRASGAQHRARKQHLMRARAPKALYEGAVKVRRRRACRQHPTRAKARACTTRGAGVGARARAGARARPWHVPARRRRGAGTRAVAAHNCRSRGRGHGCCRG